jgi:hypothetical protein
MPTNPLYDTVIRKLQQLRPSERITRLRNLAWLMTGIFKSKSVHLSKVAMKIPGTAVQLSIVQRLHRFLENPFFHVRTWYEPIARQLLEETGRVVGEIRLVMDATKCGQDHQWLTVSVAFRRRTIPIAWTWLQGSRGHSSATVQLALLKYVHTFVPSNVPVFLVADTEFEDGDVQKQVNAWSWFYVLRQKPTNLVNIAGDWRSLRSLVSKPGQSMWLTSVLLTQKHQLTANVLAYWKPGEEFPWLLATNLPSQHETLKVYKRRMWIEEMHGDLKAHGFYLEDSHLSSFTRLSRLTFAVVLLYLWVILEGAKVIKSGQRRLVDRNDRRDLSVFQIGLRSIERRLTSVLPLSLPSAIKLSGG